MFTKEMRAEISKNKEMLTNLEDAETELELADEEDPISLLFGHCFIRANIEDSQEYVAKQQKVLQKENEVKQLRVKET